MRAMMEIDMRKLISVLVGAALAAILVVIAAPAHAQIYKYRRKDGTTVYTDKLSDLPKSVRAKYAAREAKKAQERRRLEASLGKAEVARREAEERRQRHLREQIAAAKQKQRRRELKAMMKRINKSSSERDAKKAKWQQRVSAARKKVDELYADFGKTRQAYDQIAVRADYALFPGENKQKGELKKKLDRLEKELDAALEELNVKIPNEARRAGVPPGWLRVPTRRNPPT